MGKKFEIKIFLKKIKKYKKTLAIDIYIWLNIKAVSKKQQKKIDLKRELKSMLDL